MAIAVPPRLKFGTLELPSRVLVAPMVGITDAPCRALANELGVGLVSTEMVAADAVVREIPAAMRMLDFPAEVRPAGAQLIGKDPAVMADAAQIAVARGAMTVDVNLGCPVRKVVSQGTGACLARDIDATVKVLAAMVDAVDVPVTAKMRTGWDHTSINAPQLARALQEVGVGAVTVHGRTRCQGYAGAADWAEIARVKEAVDIPVIGSGDVVDIDMAADRIAAGAVDGVVIARGMLGNFWRLRQAVHFLETGRHLDDLSFPDRIALSRRHLNMLCAYYGDKHALRVGRKYVSWTIRGCAGAARLRALVRDLDSRTMLDDIFNQAVQAGQGPQGWFEPIFTSGEG